MMIVCKVNVFTPRVRLSEPCGLCFAGAFLLYYMRSQPKLMFVTDDLKAAVIDAQRFEQESGYGDLMCLNKVRGGVKYGTFEDWVLSLEAVLPTGEVIGTGSKTSKSVSGYNLTGLLTGSEGTLAIITKVRAKMTAIPETRMITTAYFKIPEDAGRASFKIMVQGLNPAAMELLDKTTMDCISQYLKIEFPPAIGSRPLEGLPA